MVDTAEREPWRLVHDPDLCSDLTCQACFMLIAHGLVTR